MAPDRCSRQVSSCPIRFPKKHGGLVRVGVDGRRGLLWPWEVIWGGRWGEGAEGRFYFHPQAQGKAAACREGGVAAGLAESRALHRA